MTIYEHAGTAPAQQIPPSPTRRRAPLSTTERWSAGTVALALAVIVLGALTPGYELRSDAVSRLACPGEPWALAAFVAYGLLVLAGGGLVAHYAGRYRRTLTCGLTLYGLASIVAGVAPKTSQGHRTPPSARCTW